MNERREGQRPRRCRSDAEKLRIVEETLAAGVSVSVVARRHDVNANQVFKWRRQYYSGELIREDAPHPDVPCKTSGHGAGLVPVGVIGDGGRVCSLADSVAEPYTRLAPAQQREPRSSARPTQRPGLIEFDLRGGSRIRMEAGVDAEVLQQVLALIERLA